MMQDIRLALRSVLRAPSYSVMVVGSLAVGIAAPVLAFSLLNSALLRPLDGVDDRDGLVRLALTDARGQRWSLGATYDLYAAVRSGVRNLASVAAWLPADFVLSHDEREPIVVNGEIVSANYFETLKVRPAAGRFFTGAEEIALMSEPVVVIAYEVWRRQFQLSPDVVGRYVLVNGTPLQIVGVAPERFDGVQSAEEQTRLWVPLGLAELALRRNGRPAPVQNAGAVNLGFAGRLQPGVGIEQLAAAASRVVSGQATDEAGRRGETGGALSRQLAATRGSAPVGMRVTEFWRGGLEPDPLQMAELLVGFMALPLLVLGIACINAGNVVLARAMRSTHTWSLQLALGASRRRLLRQPIVEGLALAIPAAALGLLLTRWGFIAMDEFVPFTAVIDTSVVVFAFATAAATPLLFGLGPAWSVLSRTRRGAPGRLLQASSRSRARTGLLIVQTALSLGLLGTGTQFVRTYRDGFGDGLGPGDRMLIASFDVDKLRFTREDTDAYYARLLERVTTVPGANRAALMAGANPTRALGTREGQTALWLASDPPDKPRPSQIMYATPNLLSTIGTVVRRGREFSDGEYRGPLRAVMVDEPFVGRYLQGNPVGQSIRLRPLDATVRAEAYAAAVDAVIVGVVASPGRGTGSLGTVYAPVSDVHLPARMLYIPFSSADALAAASAPVRDAIRQADPRVPHTLATLDDDRWQRSEPRRFMAVAVAVLGGLALILAAVGLYGAVSYVVELRRREIGVRMAVGATSATILRTIVREAMTIAVVGTVLGTASAAALSVIVRSTMYGTATLDGVAFGGAVTVLMATMLLASVVPAARAARIDPAVTLRAD